MKLRTLTLVLSVALLAPALSAQDPHFGMGLNLVFPTGAYNSTTYPANAVLHSPQKEGYDLGLGGQFFVSFPVSRQAAIRLELGGQSTNGTNTAAGYEKLNTRHGLFSLGGSVELFPGEGNAFRHKGTYLLAGLAADFERFDRSYGDVDNDQTVTDRKSRLGGNFGIGHSFGYDSGMRFTLEGTYHKTLSGIDTDYQMPATDFVRVSVGVVF